jgi:hypothetical protein
MEEVLQEKATERVRSRTLSIPARIVLNEAGIAFFAQNKQALHRFTTADGDPHYGLHFNSVSFWYLKTLFLDRFVERLEIRVSDISKNHAILSDLVKLVFFSMFRHRITLSLLDQIYQSPILRVWNRVNPKKAIGPGIVIPKNTLWALLDSVKDKIKMTQTELQCYILKILPPAEKSGWDEKRKLNNFALELVEDLDPLILFVLAGSKEEDKHILLRKIAMEVSQFIRMVSILDMASLLSIELVSDAERVALQRVLLDSKLQFGKAVNFKDLVNSNKIKGTTMVVSIPTYLPPDSSRLKFRISVYNDNSDVEAEQKLMEDFMGRTYRFKPESGAEKDVEDHWQYYNESVLRFHYLSIIRGLCKKHNVLVDFGMKKSPSGRSVVTTLSFGF